jgi:hypothetical protein
MSATVVISTPPGTPAMFSAARTSWCSISETEFTSSTREYATRIPLSNLRFMVT